jgi:thiol:disulfide interchange protein DsbA
MKHMLIALCMLITPSFFAYSADYVEGVHYKVIPGAATTTPELREYFSYYCPACRSFEAHLPGFKEILPANALFKKTHVDFMRQTGSDIQFLLGKAQIVAQKTGFADKFNAEVFSHIQTKRQPVTSIDDVKEIFMKAGGDAAKFDAGMKGFSIVGQAKQNKKVQDKLSRGRYLTSVPTFVVNGKYIINSKALDKNNPIEDYKKLIAHLFTLD